MANSEPDEYGSAKDVNSASLPQPPVLFIGRNRRGCWIVRDELGKRGALFVSQAEALRFAMFETDYRPNAIVMTSECLELDMSGSGKAAAGDALHAAIAGSVTGDVSSL
ncbi:MAG TPA: hypothetical protein VE986_07480 [Hyphomicrobiales bacterium]|nr:hypothetical protein [Hyphomicrobiales bacterium]